MHVKSVILPLITLGVLALAGGCREKTTTEMVADKIETTADKTADAFKEGAKKVSDGAGKAYDKTKDAVKDGAKAVGDAVQKAGDTINKDAQKAGEKLQELTK